jgi:hypothetical protein
MADAAREIIPFTNPATIDPYLFLHDAYYGTGGFRNGNYLVPYVRTDPEAFKELKALAYYANYVKPIVNSHISPIFSKPRQWVVAEGMEDEPFLTSFLEDADAQGHPLERFVKWAARMAKLYGCAFGLVDNFRAEEIPDNQAASLAGRLFPYAVGIAPAAVSAWVLDSQGRFTSFTYLERVEGSVSQIKIYKTWTREEWFRSDKEGNKLVGDGAEHGYHDLGRVPIASLYAFDREDMSEVLPLSEFYGVARLNHRIYNLDAEITELSRSQAYSIFCYPGQPASLTAGPRSAIAFAKDASKGPYFESPDAEQLRTLLESRGQMVNELYRQAQLTHLHAGESSQASGVAKSYDLEITAQALRDFTGNIEQFENELVLLFGLYRSEDYGYSVEYPRDYSLEDLTLALDQALTALSIDFGIAGNAEVKKQAARAMFTEPDQLAIVEGSIEEQQGDAANAGKELAQEFEQQQEPEEQGAPGVE